MISVGEDYWMDNSRDALMGCREALKDWLPTHCDDWEVGLVMDCICDLTSHVFANGMVFPDAVGIHDESMGTNHPMHPYMQIAWSYLTNRILGEEIPMKYEVVT